MKAWYFTETAYPHLPPENEYDSIRLTLPNRLYDPKIGAKLYDRYIDEWLVAESEGLNLMMNEHHQTATCVDPAAPMMLAALARLTNKARLLILGNPVSNRREPVRIAEEMAFADNLSHGRIEVGFVRGVPYEIAAANSNPIGSNERQWEAIDLIIKAWTSHDGPFSHEGRYFHHRNVNIWPRPYQAPHPPVWVSSTSAGGANKIGTKGFVQATFLSGSKGTKDVFEAYRKGWRSAGLGNDVPIDRLAYSPILYTAETREKARAGVEKLMWYVRSNKVPPHYANPPGYFPVEANVKFLRGVMPPVVAFLKKATIDEAIEAGMIFSGTPDDVLQQITAFYNRVGGFGHLLIMGQAGFLDHEETVHGIRMFAREVYPRLQELYPDSAVSGQFNQPSHAS